MSRARPLDRLLDLLADLAVRLGGPTSLGGISRAGTTLGISSMRLTGAGVHGAALQHCSTASGAAGGGGGGKTPFFQGSGSSLLSSARQHHVALCAPVSRRVRQGMLAAASSSAGWQPSPAGSASMHAAAAAEPAPLLELPSISSSTAAPSLQTGSFGELGQRVFPVATSGFEGEALSERLWDLGAPSSSSSSRPPAAAAAAAARAGLEAGEVYVEGTVQKITFRAADTAYTVMKVQLSPSKKASSPPGSPRAGASAGSSSSSDSGTGSGAEAAASSSSSSVWAGRDAAAAALPAGMARRRVITVVGNLPQVAIGQALRLRGSWVQHKQYGQQLRATDMEEISPGNEGEMVAYLGGGAIPGVGPVTAQRMVAKWGTDIEARLNSRSAVRYLVQCDGIQAAKAEKIKAAWDATKGTREGVAFLKEHGIPLPLAQRIAERCGQQTVARVQADPYAALAGCGLPFSKVDQLAAKVGARPDLVSRAASAMQQCLSSAAAEEGHTYLPWHRLEKDCGRLLNEAGLHHAAPWQHASQLHLVAQAMHAGGAMVAEPAGAAGTAAVPGGTDAGASGAQLGIAGELLFEGSEGGAFTAAAATAPPSAAASPSRGHPVFEGDGEALRAYLRGKLKGVAASVVESLLAAHGTGAPAVLDLEFAEAVEELCKCRKVGPKTAEKIKLAWEAAHGNTLAAPPGASGPAGAMLGAAPGTTMQQLMDAPPALGFPWGPATRCYSPHLHAAEQVVTQRSLQRAAAYKQPSTRQLNRVRKWVEANEANSQREAAGAAAADIQLNGGQVRAIEVASDAPLMVLTGGPGCGKTTAVQTIVKLWCAQGKMVRIAAPTGRAAQRMGEIQGIEPCTIHRLLGYMPRGSGDGEGGGRGGGSAAGGGGGGFQDLDAGAEEARLGTQGTFVYHRGNPLPADAVLVDEASMLSLPLAAALIDALRPKCQLVLVGDVDQLPPVGPGAVLQSLLASRLVPVVDLREIFRQAAESAIITSALAVRRGEVPMLQPVAPAAEAFEAATSDALLVGAAGPEDLAAAVRDTVVAMRQAHGYSMCGGSSSGSGSSGSGQAGEEGCLQVLSPMRKGPAGTTTLNPMLQALLNPPAPDKPELSRHPHASSSPTAAAAAAAAAGAGVDKVFRVGDRVIQLVNNYDKEVFNGDQGRVVACLPRERKLVVDFPHLGKQSASAGGDASGLREYQGVELSQLELAYAITVHKAQGGEAQHVVLALSPAHGRMLTRRLLYTGLTRAKQQLVVVAAGGGAGSSASTDPLAKAVRCKESEVRLTSLQARLEEGRAAAGLLEQAPQLYSNEEQMLQQAAHWQQQAAERAASERQAAAEAAAAEEARHLAADWEQPRRFQQQQQQQQQLWQPSEQQLAAMAAELQQQQGLSASQAEQLLSLMQQRCPQALQDWERSTEALAWLRRECGEGLTLEQVVRQAPLLLAMSELRLEKTRRFVAARELALPVGGSGDGGASSAVEGLLCLLAAEGAGVGLGVRQQQQQQQQQQPAG